MRADRRSILVGLLSAELLESDGRSDEVAKGRKLFIENGWDWSHAEEEEGFYLLDLTAAGLENPPLYSLR